MFIKRISQEYKNYNPENRTVFRKRRCFECGKNFWEEVGIFNKEDSQFANPELDICKNGEEFTVINLETYKGKIYSEEEMIKEEKENEDL